MWRKLLIVGVLSLACLQGCQHKEPKQTGTKPATTRSNKTKEVPSKQSGALWRSVYTVGGVHRLTHMKYQQHKVLFPKGDYRLVRDIGGTHWSVVAPDKYLKDHAKSTTVSMTQPQFQEVLSEIEKSNAIPVSIGSKYVNIDAQNITMLVGADSDNGAVYKGLGDQGRNDIKLILAETNRIVISDAGRGKFYLCQSPKAYQLIKKALRIQPFTLGNLSDSAKIKQTTFLFDRTVEKMFTRSQVMKFNRFLRTLKPMKFYETATVADAAYSTRLEYRVGNKTYEMALAINPDTGRVYDIIGVEGQKLEMKGDYIDYLSDIFTMK